MKKEHKSDEPKAANEAIRIPTMGDFLPFAIPVAITAAPPPGISIELPVSQRVRRGRKAARGARCGEG